MAMWDARGIKSDFEERAYRNEQFLWGKQWYWWDDGANDGSGGMVPRTDVEGWRARMVYNDTLDTVEQLTAKMIRTAPAWNYFAQTDEPYDRIVQRRNQQVMEWTWSDGIKMPGKLRTTLQWAFSSAGVFARPFWNRKKGPKITVKLDEFRAQGAMVADPVQRQDVIREADNRFWQLFGQDAYQKGEAVFHSGEPDVDIHPIFEVMWWPLRPKTWADVKVWMVTVKKTVAEVAEEYGLDQEKVREMAHPTNAKGGYGSSISKWGDKYFWERDDEAFYEDDCVLVHMLYSKPCGPYPKGRMAIVVGQGGETVFGPQDINNPLTEAPIIPLVQKPIRGNALGTCVVDQMIPAQEALNAEASMVVDYLNKKIAPTLVDFIGNEMGNQQALTNAPGKIYRVPTADKIPQAIKMPDIGFDYFNMMEINRMWLQRMSGIASIDEGRTDDANVRSGRAILALREQNDLRLIPFGEALDEWVQEIGNFVIAMWWEYATNERLIQLVGEGNKMEVLVFKAEDLRPNGYEQPGFNKAVIRSKAFSNIPRSPQEVMNFLTILGNNGMLLPEDRNSVVEMMGYAEFRKLTDKRRKDQDRQWYEIEQWKRGIPVGPPDDSALDDVHIEAIDLWQKTDEFKAIEKAAQIDPRAAMLLTDILDHKETHRKWQARKLVDQQYQLLDADLTMWMKHRGSWMQQFSQSMQAGQTPDPQAFAVVSQLYALPLGIQTGTLGQTGAVQTAAGGNENQQQGGGKQDEKKGRDPNGTSPNQGVSKNENSTQRKPALA